MNRELVEDATHPEVLHSISEELGHEWLKHEEHIYGAGFARNQMAATMLVRRDRPFGDRDTLFPAERSGVDERIKTRLGQDDRRVEFDRELISPFNERFSVLNLPAHLVPGTKDTSEPKEILKDNGELTFIYGEVKLKYDRLGLRPE